MREQVDAALAALDRAAADSPEDVPEDLAHANRRIAELRDVLIAQSRAGEPVGDRLKRLNAVLSTTVAAEFPLEGIRRDRIKHARKTLADIFPA